MAATFKVNKTGNFTILSNYHLQDKALSLKAKGLLTLMLSLDDLWKYSVRGLAGTSKDSVQSVTSGLKELEERGYVERHQLMKNGQFAGVQYVIYEIPPQEVGEYLQKTKDALLGTGCSKSEHPQNSSSAGVSQIRTLGKKRGASKKTANTSDTNGLRDSVDPSEKTAVSRFPVTENPYTVEGVSQFPVTGNPYTENPDTEKPSPLPYKKLNNINNTSPVNLSINQSSTSTEEDAEPLMDGLMDYQQEEVFEQVAEQLGVEDLTAMYPVMEAEIQETAHLVAEVITSQSSDFCYRINGASIPARDVAARFRRLTGDQLMSAVDAICNTTYEIKNPRSYMISTLYNAVTTTSLRMSADISAQSQSDQRRQG